MQLEEQRFVPVEFKFVSESGTTAGEFDGYGAVFNSIDSHGDVILPGAFTKTLAEHKANGTMPGLYIEHGQYSPFGPAPLPVGVWTDMQEDDKGLRVKGKISALDTDDGRKVRGLMQDGAIRGLSIAYKVPSGGATINKKAASGEPRRFLKSVDLDSIDLVRSPSNSGARVDAVKSLLAPTDRDAAVAAAGAAIALHKATMSGGDSPSADERATMLQHLHDVHRALTGQDEPSGAKSAPKTIREFETMLREELGYSNTQARSIAEGGFKSSLPREEAGETATKALKSAFAEIGDALKSFTPQS